MCVFACACVCLYVKCTLHVSVHVRRRRRRRMGGLGEEWGSGIGDESRLLCVVFVDRVSSSVSGEVEWLVPAYHVATGKKQINKNKKMENQKQRHSLDYESHSTTLQNRKEEGNQRCIFP